MLKRLLCLIGIHKSAPFYVGWDRRIWNECERCGTRWRAR